MNFQLLGNSKIANIAGMILDGKALSNKIQDEIKSQVSNIKGRKPCLAVVLVGNNPASVLYTNRKVKACENIGFKSIRKVLSDEIQESELLKIIDDFNNDVTVDGILVQLPLPEHIRTLSVIAAIDPEKDVDGFHPLNVGKLLIGDKSGFVPCTPLGVQKLLTHYNIEIAGKHVVIVGRSNIVGKPLAALLMQQAPGANATVTVANSKTKNLSEITRQADILVAAMGKPHFIKKEMVKKDAVVVDVGLTSIEGKLVGDVDTESVKSVTSAITPVPGGVGPMTIAMLLENTLLSFKRRCR